MMIDLALEDVARAHEVGTGRMAHARAHGWKPTAGYDQGTRDFHGALGELALASASGLPWHDDTGRCDTADVGDWEVKTSVVS